MGQGRHWVRGHYRRNPAPRAAKSGWWVVAAAAVVLLWIAPSGGGDGEPETAPTAPASAGAGR
ncbi:hypothetical protein [Kitasatospora sp. NPDC051914]|uniref:hypothetical protein n=1 Tax=Kitasatospora sp. NPDC051914 TaxID=3154945 RepID=UPI00341E60DE